MSNAKADTYLDELYLTDEGHTFMTGIQALVRLPLAQRNLDRKNGHNTAGLVSGYRGSPIGAYDQQLWKAASYLKSHDVVFQPGLNEDLAATALWGAQMHTAYGASDVEGVFGIWYGKGNGVDRTGDAFRNANMVGTSKLGGVLAVGGDDHAAQSSMFPHQTEGIFQSVMMPVLQPSTVGEILSLGLAGIALSRYSGLWVSMKTIAEVVESAAAFDLPNLYPVFNVPDMGVPPRGFGWDPTIRWPAERAELERRMYDERLPAVNAWAKANPFDYPLIQTKKPRLVIVSVGKTRQDVMEALQNMGISGVRAAELGIAVYHVAMSWPFQADPLFAFSKGAEEILVVEEKSPVVEDQIKAAFFNRKAASFRITGKKDTAGKPLLPAVSELSPELVVSALAKRMKGWLPDDVKARIRKTGKASGNVLSFPSRRPFFCAGCPHNSSTKTPDGSIAGGGIGCHIMALSEPNLKTSTFSQMGGEGVQWVGAAPFSKTEHVFQNLGDGTYQHSGVLAVRAAVAAKANITFKIFYNDAVAMTGGQPAEGAPEPVGIIAQLLAEGVGKVYLVSDNPDQWRKNSKLSDQAHIEHRDYLETVQKELRETPGVTAIVYEQTCASEKRRRRKRGSYPDPAKRLFINERVCEGCGDCSIQSNCIAVEPLETSYGRKRKINQSSCNKDFSCLKGFCPSFVEVGGPVLRTPDTSRIKGMEDELFAGLPEVAVPQFAGEAYNVFTAGIGGQGVLTIGAVIGTAAFRADIEATVLDFTGLAQKNGGVASEVRIAEKGTNIEAVRIGEGKIDLLIASDLVAASNQQTLKKISRDRTVLVGNLDVAPTADTVRNRDATLPVSAMQESLKGRVKASYTLKATRIAEGIFGNAIAANMIMLGFAWQHGLLPLTQEQVFLALEANGTAVSANKRAFLWGRLAAIDEAKVEQIAGMRGVTKTQAISQSELAQQYYVDLAAYQNAAYAERYKALLERTEMAVRGAGETGKALLEAVTKNAYKLMAYKDEYEVARLYSEPAFQENLKAQFSDMKKLSIWLAPPLITRTDAKTGRPKKIKFGPWVFTIFKMLASMKGLRGTWLDPFGKTAERRQERALIADYFNLIDHILGSLTEASLPVALELAELPADVRGFGPVKEAAFKAYFAQKTKLLKAFEDSLNSSQNKAA